jgi:hypothetical protein
MIVKRPSRNCRSRSPIETIKGPACATGTVAGGGSLGSDECFGGEVRLAISGHGSAVRNVYWKP